MSASEITFALSVVVVLIVLWMVGHKSALDEGGYTDSWDTKGDMSHAFDSDKVAHAVGGVLTAVVGLLVFHVEPVTVWIITTLGWVAVELIQRFPRLPYKHGRPGLFSWRDAVAASVGAAAVCIGFALTGAA